MKFMKMHGLGNDFMVLDGVRQTLDLTTEKIQAWSDRHTGVGFDQLLILSSTDKAGMDFRYRIFNADGSEVGQCGNGARAVARFGQLVGLTDKDTLNIETATSDLSLKLFDDGNVEVILDHPQFIAEGKLVESYSDACHYEIKENSQALNFVGVDVGNPHVVTRVDAVATAPVYSAAEMMMLSPHFPSGVNVGFMEVLGTGHIQLRVHERGVGETQACGSGACAAMVAGRVQSWLDDTVVVDMPGGSLTITWPGEGHPLTMRGPAVAVYEGVLL